MLAQVREAIDSAGFDDAAKLKLDRCAMMLQEALDNSGSLHCPLAIAAATPRSAVVLCAPNGWPEVADADAARSRRDADEVAALLAAAIESKTSIPGRGSSPAWRSSLAAPASPLKKMTRRGSRRRARGR